uniref:Putative secreted peptide n=1 Tax=Anopheles braziliensis TaxID=58242 RepID=A0A2M3ZSF3_9DIPT
MHLLLPSVALFVCACVCWEVLTIITKFSARDTGSPSLLDEKLGKADSYIADSDFPALVCGLGATSIRDVRCSHLYRNRPRSSR